MHSNAAFTCAVGLCVVPLHVENAATVDVGVSLVSVVKLLEGQTASEGGGKSLYRPGISLSLGAVAACVHLGHRDIRVDFALNNLVGNVAHHRGSLA